MRRPSRSRRAGAGDPGPKLVTRPFVLVTASGLAYFLSVGVLVPVLPRYVEGPLGGGVAVGLVVGAFSFSAAALRPFVGRMGDRSGRRRLVVGGALVVAASVALYDLATTLPALFALRLVTGAGEAAVFVGAATAIQDLAPGHRRGEAASYFSVAVYGGLALGPALGETVLDGLGYTAAWLLAAASCVAAAVLGWWTPATAANGRHDGHADRGARTVGRQRILHPSAVLPGAILGLSLIGFAGFATFLPLYVGDIGLDGSRVAFALYAVLILAVRVVGARVPDAVGPIRTASFALVAVAGGLLLMAAWRSPAGLYLGTGVLAVGMSLVFPSLLALVVDAAPEAERSSAVATFSLFFDLSHGVGVVLLGAVVAVSDEPVAFAVGGVMALFGLVLVRRLLARPAAAAGHDPGPLPLAP